MNNAAILRAAEMWTFSKAVKALSGLNRRILEKVQLVHF